MMSPEELRVEIKRLISDNITMRTAIKRALADAESGNGWGPDVTICEYLNTAITQYNQSLEPTDITESSQNYEKTRIR
jgi:hypothetical protein